MGAGGSRPRIGLVLSGGGARGAYQAGVVRAVAEIARSLKIENPISILTGVSAGAVNATYLAANCDDLVAAAENLTKMWTDLRTENVFRTDLFTAGWLGAKFFTDATVGALYKKKLARSLLDTAPLRDFLGQAIAFDRIESQLAAGYLDAVAISAMNYTDSVSTTFVQGHPRFEMWERSRRLARSAKISVDHVMASAAIPLFFPPVPLGDDHFGDGCLRNTAPLSPAIHLGADRLLVISARKPEPVGVVGGRKVEPSIARVLGLMLNALLLDAIDVDMERMQRVNSTVSLVPSDTKNFGLRKVEYLWIRPSGDMSDIAFRLTSRLPRVLRYLLAGLGTSRESAELTSYLLFEPEFTGHLSEMGYQDGLKNREAIEALFK